MKTALKIFGNLLWIASIVGANVQAWHRLDHIWAIVLSLTCAMAILGEVQDWCAAFWGLKVTWEVTER